MDVTTANGAYDNPTLPLSAMQPTLQLILIAHHPMPCGTVTAIVRRQDPEGVPLCQLCPKGECATAADGTCLVTVEGYVSEAAAASFARTGSVVASVVASRALRTGSGRMPRH
jgi:hypothetical protein